MNWLIISGTNRPQSNTLKVSNHLAGLLKTNLRDQNENVAVLDLQNLPLEIFAPSAYASKPSSFDSFREAVLKADAVISVLPEYNGSAPGVFKYFLDMLPFPQSLQKIPCAFVGLSSGRFGSLRSVEHMQQIFGYRNAFIFPERIFIPAVDKSIDENGKPKEDFIQQLMEQMMIGFILFTRSLRKPS
ncbi:MAG: flavoprotein [Deltaproteobacteria bacterium CG11_big_fil_rev_8_21_14_0_20_45_16]|nr:MAG: flavoprotein [Deltaproteobacteria bacterium CG11_big_fil_rev_8_21_14_0_20_45_16]